MCAVTRQTELRSIHHVFKFKECHHPHPTPPHPTPTRTEAVLVDSVMSKSGNCPGPRGYATPKTTYGLNPTISQTTAKVASGRSR